MPFLHNDDEGKCAKWMIPAHPFVEGCDECCVEAWERMTDGGIQLTPDSRQLLDWLSNVRFDPFGENHWTVKRPL